MRLSDESTVRAALVGTGFMGSVHTRSIRAARSRLVAVAGSTPERGADAAHRLGFERSARDLRELLTGADVDIVHVCTPNAQHASQAIAALGAGKHVVCEKPLAVTVDDARSVVEAADRADRVGAVPFVYRYHPAVRHAHSRIASGQTGTVLSISGSYLQDWMLRSEDTNWRADSDLGGASRAFADIGSHLCDLIEFVTADRIRAVSASLRTVFSERDGQSVSNEDIAALVVELEGGAIGSLLVSQVAPGRKNGLVLEIHGDTESVRFAQERPEELWVGRRTESSSLLRDPDAAGDEGLSILPAGHSLGYQDAFNAFVADAHAAVQGKLVAAMPTFRDGLRSAEITQAVLASARTKTWVDVPPHSARPKGHVA